MLDPPASMGVMEGHSEMSGGRRCPRCAGDDVSVVEYGLPDGPPEPGVVLGGCVVGPALPTRVCGTCGHEWGRLGEQWATDGADR